MSVSLSPSHPGRLRAWVLAARPQTLPAAIAPVVVGSAAAFAAGSFRWLPFLAALVGALLIQIGTNLANDYFDFRKGADTAERLGPVRVTQAGLLAPEAVRNGMIVTFGAAALIGVYLIAVGGWPILVIGILSIAAGVLYTGGPWPLGYNGLGDLFTFIFFGIVAVTATAYLHVGAVPPLAWAASIPVAMLVTAIIVVNNLRDIATDRAAGKRTLAVIVGARATRAEYALLVGGAFLAPPLLWLSGLTGPWVMLAWLATPLAIAPMRTMLTSEGRALNLALKGTARLHLVFGLLLALGMVL
ncbi:MAG: 1,4-dihydroxy-2-naphthoate polyprenyltransferase [Roseiflexus sp.]|nr:1,4-dihydroxy-2-naphthoate polyprenyltransferase [Roseiflexus sp.]MDW8148059.1 1,4-dihydroxy-2-naphthoate polyprenyltransferase [Roseiflexaceae bacterium]